jgi:hypothetical protein
MGFRFLPIFLFLCLAGQYAKSQLAESETDSTKTEFYYNAEKCAEDLLYLHKKLQDAHPCLYCYTDSVTVQSQFDLLSNNLQKESSRHDTQLTETAFTLLVKEYLAVIQDGHLDANNHVALNRYIYNKGRFFPLQLLFADGQVYIKHDFSGFLDAAALGARITSINGVPVETIVASMFKASSADAGIQIYKMRQLENLERFSIYYWMMYGPADTYTLTYTMADNQALTTSLPGITAREIIKANEKLSAEPRLHINNAASIAYMDINSFEGVSKKPQNGLFWKFLENSFKKINQDNIGSLIIDLRDNPGGMIYHAHLLLNYISPENIESAFQIKSSYLLKESKSSSLLEFLQRNFDKGSYAAKIARTPVGRYIPFSSRSHFIANEKLKFKGKVYLLVNGNTFSAAGLFTKYFKEHNLGIVLGEECGASPSFSFGNTLLVNLPNTGVQVYLPTAIVSNDTLHNYQNRGIMPDIDICRDIAAEAKNEDSVLKQVFELIGKDHPQLVSSNGN